MRDVCACSLYFTFRIADGKIKDSSTLKKEAADSYQTLLHIYDTTCGHNPDHSNLQSLIQPQRRYKRKIMIYEYASYCVGH